MKVFTDIAEMQTHHNIEKVDQLLAYTRNIDFRDWVDFRYEFMVEEACEFHDAYNENDLAGMIDACIDIMVIAAGTLNQMGVTPEHAEDQWNEVLRANMTKKVAVSPAQSKRGTVGDLYKPVGWVGPDTVTIMRKHKYG